MQPVQSVLLSVNLPIHLFTSSLCFALVKQVASQSLKKAIMLSLWNVGFIWAFPFINLLQSKYRGNESGSLSMTYVLWDQCILLLKSISSKPCIDTVCCSVSFVLKVKVKPSQHTLWHGALKPDSPLSSSRVLEVFSFGNYLLKVLKPLVAW